MMAMDDALPPPQQQQHNSGPLGRHPALDEDLGGMYARRPAPPQQQQQDRSTAGPMATFDLYGNGSSFSQGGQQHKKVQRHPSDLDLGRGQQQQQTASLAQVGAAGCRGPHWGATTGPVASSGFVVV